MGSVERSPDPGSVLESALPSSAQVCANTKRVCVCVRAMDFHFYLLFPVQTLTFSQVSLIIRRLESVFATAFGEIFIKHIIHSIFMSPKESFDSFVTRFPFSSMSYSFRPHRRSLFILSLWRFCVLRTKLDPLRS